MPPQKFSHVAMKSNDAKAALAWYCDLLEGKPVFESPAFCFMTYDDEHHRLVWFNLPETKTPDHSGPGLEHLAFGYDGLRALLAQWKRMKQLGYEPHVVVNHGITISLYYKDPDGNVAECFTDSFATPDEATAFMHSELFKKNPVGYFVEPAELLERLDNGASEEELLAFDEERALQVDVMGELKRHVLG